MAAVHIEERPGCACPPSGFGWPTSTPEEQGFDERALEAASSQAAAHRADSLLVIRNGHAVLERYWNGKSARDLQQTYCGTKSVFSLLIGRLLDAGLLRELDQPVRELVEEMPAPQQQLTFRNVLAMQSGLENSMRIETLGRTGATQLEIALERQVTAAPFEVYHYNNAPYRLLFTALERATGRDLETLTREELFEPLSSIYAADNHFAALLREIAEAARPAASVGPLPWASAP